MTRYRSLFSAAMLAAATSVALVGCGSAGMKKPMTAMKADGGTMLAGVMSGANEVPPNKSAATGSAEAWLDKDTRMLKWKVSYSGLTGPASAGHIHGPALAGANAGVLIPFASPSSPIEGQASLTAQQMTDLMAGKMYVNIHTKANPGGEIRAQLLPKM